MIFKIFLLTILFTNQFQNSNLSSPFKNIEINEQFLKINAYVNFYNKLHVTENWEALTYQRELKVGDTSQLIIKTKQELFLTGYLNNFDKKNTIVFDNELESALTEFQKKNNLKINGHLTKETFTELQKTLKKRSLLIRINAKRWQHFKPDSTNPYILINIATQDLLLVKKDSVLLNMNIIVGRNDRQTPIFNSKINYVEFNPYWIIPPGIMKNDIIPKLLKDPNYIEKNNMKIMMGKSFVNQNSINWKDTNVINLYKIVEYPSFKNPMGLVKFEFPNRNYIYLHDTPNKELFLKKPALYSSGCIRIQKATELARYILKNDLNWDNKKTDDLIIMRENKKIKLFKPINIYIENFTAWVNKDGSINFSKDIYHLDK